MIANIYPHLESIKIRPDYLDLHPRFQELKAPIIHEGYDWLHKIYDNQFEAFKSVLRLLTPEQWKRYQLWEDFGDHREVVMLRDAKTALRKALVSQTRPQLFKKGYVNAQFKEEPCTDSRDEDGNH
jgi:hypothetical protein